MFFILLFLIQLHVLKSLFMNNKIFYVIVFYTIQINFCASQSEYCNDTSFYNNVLRKSQDKTVYCIGLREYISSHYISNSCRLKFYAFLIDELFSKGLDLEMKFRIGYRDNTIVGDTTLKYIPYVDSSYLKYQIKKDLFLFFAETNKSFEQFCNIHFSQRQEECDLICNNIIEYGNFKKPDKVKNFMNHKYKKINKDYYFDQIRKLKQHR